MGDLACAVLRQFLRVLEALRRALAQAARCRTWHRARQTPALLECQGGCIRILRFLVGRRFRLRE